MDKLKPLVRLHFWILCGVILVTCIGLGFWSMTSQSAEIAKNKSSISSAEGLAKGVMSVKADVGEAQVDVHPNDKTKEGMTSEIEQGRKEVLSAWEKLHSEQKDLLAWPKNVLEPSVAAVFDRLQPERMEFDPNSDANEVPEAVRKRVKANLPAVFPKLAESVRSTWSDEIEIEALKLKKAASGEAETEQEKTDMEVMLLDQPLVKWSVGDQSIWYNQATNFKGRNGNRDISGTPTTMQILYLKEDLVLLNGVLEIVKAVNQNATIASQAGVKEIQRVMIGKEAHEATPMESTAAAGGQAGYGGMDVEQMMKMMDPSRRGAADAGPDGAVSGDEKDALDPANLRYVDKDFKPIPAAEYRTAVQATELSEKTWMAVVKRVPVRIRMMVDERKIDDILEACANAKIPLEVRQITLIGGELPEDTSSSTVAGKGGKGGNGGSSRNVGGADGGQADETSEMSNDLGGGIGAGGGEAGESKNFSSAEFNPHFDVPLEIYGIMKIHNPPSPGSIGRSDAETQTASLNP